jgi:predicted metal-dependent phosphoesterase TrpH
LLAFADLVLRKCDSMGKKIHVVLPEFDIEMQYLFNDLHAKKLTLNQFLKVAKEMGNGRFGKLQDVFSHGVNVQYHAVGIP